MRINIAASHRFHLLDLARELADLGHEVRFYSYVPTKRAIKYGLKKENCKSLFYILLPFIAFVKLSKGADWAVKLQNLVLDYYVAWFMYPCDVYIALGTVYKKSFISAKERFGAITILEWGSKHNEEQQKALSQIPGLKPQAYYFKKRALDGYELSDYISIPSEHVMQSFLDRGFEAEKFIQNPYGVDLSMFLPTKLTDENPYDVIMVGGWNYIKGSDMLVEFFKNSNLTFLHVGPIVNLSFPEMKNMIHVDAVDQSTLIEYYAKAKVFVLPSRADGFGMVLSQALASGLPIVCSMHTGGRDLQKFLKEKQWIIEMEEYTLKALSNCIHQALSLAETQSGKRNYAETGILNLTWEAYGKRYAKNLERISSNLLIKL